MKRVLFLISDRYAGANGGIGSFMKGFWLLCQERGWVMDIVVDQRLRDNPVTSLVRQTSRVVGSHTTSFAEHREMHRYNDTINFFRVLNFKKALMEALEDAVYDAIIVNDEEGILPAMSLALPIPVIYVTHNPESIVDSEGTSPFHPLYLWWMQEALKTPGLIVATQSEKNVSLIKEEHGVDAMLLPYPIPEQGLLQGAAPLEERGGILYIGTFQDRKDPREYIRVAKTLGLKPKVMTSQAGVRKFEKAFSEVGITDYDVRHSITGTEKVDFIRSARVAYHPSKSESFGYAVLEAACVVPTFILEEYAFWTDMHREYTTVVPRTEVVSAIRSELESPRVQGTEVVEFLTERTAGLWAEVIEGPRSSRSNTSAKLHAWLMEKGGIPVRGYYHVYKERKTKSIEDVQTLHRAVCDERLKVVHFHDESFIGAEGQGDLLAEPQAPPQEELTLF
jgi:glycosyltransferase involved in cell wall biosynthesis